jgi:hypothetical protein
MQETHQRVSKDCREYDNLINPFSGGMIYVEDTETTGKVGA